MMREHMWASSKQPWAMELAVPFCSSSDLPASPTSYPHMQDYLLFSKILCHMCSFRGWFVAFPFVVLLNLGLFHILTD